MDSGIGRWLGAKGEREEIGMAGRLHKGQRLGPAEGDGFWSRFDSGSVGLGMEEEK